MRAVVAVALGLFLFLSFGCTGSGGTNTLWEQVWPAWGGMVGTVLALVALTLGLGYMAGSLLNDEKIKAWVKKEVGQLFYSVVIMLVVLALVGSMDQWLRAISLLGSPDWQTYVNYGVCCQPGEPCLALPGSNLEMRGKPCHIAISLDYLQILYESTRLSALTFLNNYNSFSVLAALSTGFYSMDINEASGLDAQILGGLMYPAEYYSLLFDLASKTMVLLRAQQVGITFMLNPLFPLLLSMGVVLRMLYFTRKLGGLLIAIALSIYIVLPMFYVLANAILFNFLGGVTTSWVPFGSTFDPAKLASPFGQASYTYNGNEDGFTKNRINLAICNDATTQETLQDEQLRVNFYDQWDAIEGSRWYEQFLDWAGDTGSGIANGGGGFGAKGPIGMLAAIMIYTLVVPFLALMCVLATVKVVSPLLGGDVEISVLSRLI